MPRIHERSGDRGRSERTGSGRELDKRHAWRARRVAREYEERRFRGPLQALKQSRDEVRVLRALDGLDGGVRVLDLPAGTGRLFPALSRRFRLVGCDLSHAMLLQATERARRHAVSRVQAEGTSLPFRSGAFAAVVSMRFLFHFPDPETRRALLAEMARVADRLVVGQFQYRWTLKHGLRRVRKSLRLTRKYRPGLGAAELERELAAAGLELLSIEPISRGFSDKALFRARPVR